MLKRFSLITFFMILYSFSFLAAENNKILMDLSLDLSEEENKYFEYSEIITTAFRVAFEDEGYIFVNRLDVNNSIEKAKADNEKILFTDYALKAGKLAEADYVFSGFIKSDGSYIIFKLKVFDIKKNKLIISGLRNSVIGPGIYTEVDDLIYETISALDELKESVSEKNIIQQDVYSYTKSKTQIPKNIILKSKDEGAIIVFLNGPEAGVIKDGKLVIEAVPGSILEIEIIKENYHRTVQRIRIKEKKDEYSLRKLKLAADKAFEAKWKMLRADGFTFGYVKYINPGKTFYSLSSGFYYRDAEINETQVFLNESVKIGAYIPGTEDNLFRLSFSTGPGVFFTGVSLEESNNWYSDFYWTYFEETVELNLTKYSVFMKFSLDYFPGWGDSGLPSENWEEGIDFSGLQTYLSIGVMRKW